MGRPVVVDTCSLVHAKALATLSAPPLDWIAELARAGHALFDTPSCWQEKLASSLSVTLNAWEREGLIARESVKLSERRQVANRLRRRDTEPGNNDKALIALARRMDAALLTHDGPAAALARRCRVEVVDLADLAALAVSLKLREAEAMDAAWSDLEGAPWRPADWRGSLHETLRGRAHLDALLTWIQDEV